MKICRFDESKLGLIQEENILDVTEALDVLPTLKWPYPRGDQMVANLDQIMDAIRSGRYKPSIGRSAPMAMHAVLFADA